VYPKKVVMWDQVKTAVENGDERNMAMLSSSLVANIGAAKRSVENGFVELLDGPTGFMAIKRHVFEMTTKIGTLMNIVLCLTV
jgi:hypothetical protein